MDYKKKYINNISFTIENLKEIFPFLTKQQLYGFCVNAIYNANEPGENDPDLESASLYLKSDLNKADILSVLKNDDYFRYLKVNNRFNEISVGIDESLLEFYSMCEKVSISCLRLLIDNHGIEILEKDLYIYKDLDNNILLEIDCSENISMEYSYENRVASVYIHSYNHETKRSLYKTFELETKDLAKKFEKDEEITLFIKKILNY